jgi:hypothetical protein
MSKFVARVYVVQKADREGNLYGDVLAVKLTFEAAQALAVRYAPAKVTMVLADKTHLINGPHADKVGPMDGPH